MGMIIQHNLTAMNTNRYLGINNSKLSKELEIISSGYKINRAGDNAAGLAVSEKMRSQIAGMTQGVKNAQDGISMIQTFEGALTETDSILQRMKALADQMANGSYDNPVDRASAQQEFYQLADELNHIADTDFNGVVVLNGGVMSDGTAGKDGLIDYTASQGAKGAASAISGGTASRAVQTYEAAGSSPIQIYAAAPIAAGTDTICGDFTITGENLIAGTDYSFSGGVLTILSNKNITIKNTNPAAATSNRIAVASGVNANITLAGVNIDRSSDASAQASSAAFLIADGSTGNVTITLADGTDNILISGHGKAGLNKNGGTSSGMLTINGNTGTLTTRGGQDAAGIGSGMAGCHNITINGGVITATAGNEASGIGSGRNNKASNITINGGTITATGGGGDYGGSGIGGHYGASDITINGGTVTATGGTKSAGIGGGSGSDGTNITIRNANVTATGGSGAAGIGGGKNQWGSGIGSNITISNSIVRAKGDTANGADNIGNSAGAEGGNAPSIRDSLIIEDDDWSIYGDFVLKGDLTIGAEVILEISEDSSFTVGDGATLTNNGTIDVWGEIVNDGTIINNGTINFHEKSKVTGEENIKGNDPIDNRDDSGNDSTDPKDPTDGPTNAPGGNNKKPEAADSFRVSVSNAFGKSEAKLTHMDHIVFHVGARTKDAVDFTFEYASDAIGDLKADLNCSASGLGIDRLDIKTQESANYAIDRIEQALNKISLVRGTFGAIQNRLEHKIDNLNVSVENLTAAESQIRDTDIPTEMMKFTKDQILTQATQAMLAQANQQPQGVLQLLG